MSVYSCLSVCLSVSLSVCLQMKLVDSDFDTYSVRRTPAPSVITCALSVSEVGQEYRARAVSESDSALKKSPSRVRTLSSKRANYRLAKRN